MGLDQRACKELTSYFASLILFQHLDMFLALEYLADWSSLGSSLKLMLILMCYGQRMNGSLSFACRSISEIFRVLSSVYGVS